MREPKTKPTKQPVDEFIASQPDARVRTDCVTLMQIMAEASGEPPVMWGTSILGFGLRELKYANGRTAPWPYIGFAPRKQDLALYVLHGFENYNHLLEKLGPHRVGKSCLHIKRLGTVNMEVLKQLIQDVVEENKRLIREAA